jgi:hypothetical protein
MSEEDGVKSVSGRSKIFAAIMGVFAFIAALGKAFEAIPKIALDEKQRWLAEFLPDAVVVLVVIGVIPLIIETLHVDWRGSFQRIRLGGVRPILLIGVQVVAVLIAVIFLNNPLTDFYRVRYERAHLDWHLIREKDLVRIGDYDHALAEFKKRGASEAENGSQQQLEDMRLRLVDAGNLVNRFNQIRQTNRITLEELLMCQRAAVLAPRSPQVQKALEEGRSIALRAGEAYLRGVALMRQKNLRAAADEFVASIRACSRLLHQDTLVKFCQTGDASRLTEVEQSAVQYYLNAPEKELAREVWDYPALAYFRNRLWATSSAKTN